MGDDRNSWWRKRRQDFLIGILVAFGIVTIVTLRVGVIHGVWNRYTIWAPVVYVGFLAVGIAMKIRSWWRRPVYRRPDEQQLKKLW